jgi:hypothetical protein
MTDKRKLMLDWVAVVTGTLLLSFGVYGLVASIVEQVINN